MFSPTRRVLPACPNENIEYRRGSRENTWIHVPLFFDDDSGRGTHFWCVAGETRVFFFFFFLPINDYSSGLCNIMYLCSMRSRLGVVGNAYGTVVHNKTHSNAASLVVETRVPEVIMH